MSEVSETIESLRADLKALEHAKRVCGDLGFKEAIASVNSRIRILEFRVHVNRTAMKSLESALNGYGMMPTAAKNLACYISYLESELEAKIANGNVLWCLKDTLGMVYGGVTGPELFHSREDALKRAEGMGAYHFPFVYKSKESK